MDYYRLALEVLLTTTRRVAAIGDIHSKSCGCRDTVNYGTVNGVQRDHCNICRRKFADNAAAPHMRTPARQVAASLSAYFGGMSLNEVRRHLQQPYVSSPAESTVYAWLKRFSKVAGVGGLPPEDLAVWARQGYTMFVVGFAMEGQADTLRPLLEKTKQLIEG
jgi:hypothetical protein